MSETANSGYELFWEAMSGAMAVEFVLEEMALAYRLRPVDMASGEHRSPEYLALNPTGQVPALALPNGIVIGESAAIILTIGDRHPNGGLVPGFAESERPMFLRWLIYMAASPYMSFVQFNHPERFLEDTSTHRALIENARQRLDGQFEVLDRAISGDPYFLPSGLTALDLYLFMLIVFHPERNDVLARRPRLRSLYDEVRRRDSAHRVLPAHLGDNYRAFLVGSNP